MWFVISMLFVGLIAGGLARLLVPGSHSLGCWGTVLLGLVGSLVGGFLGWLIFDRDVADGAFQTSGLFGSIVGSVIALLIYRAVMGRSGSARRQ